MTRSERRRIRENLKVRQALAKREVPAQETPSKSSSVGLVALSLAVFVQGGTMVVPETPTNPIAPPPIEMMAPMPAAEEIPPPPASQTRPKIESEGRGKVRSRRSANDIDKSRLVDRALRGLYRDYIVSPEEIMHIRYDVTIDAFARRVRLLWARERIDENGKEREAVQEDRIRFIRCLPLWYQGGTGSALGEDVWNLFRARIRRGALHDIMRGTIRYPSPRRVDIAAVA